MPRRIKKRKRGSRKCKSKEYFARGLTALYDAIGKTIVEVGARLHNIPEENRPSKVIFVIITDGMDNQSEEFSQQKIAEMVKRQRDEYNWSFLFLGANIDAESTGVSMGIAQGCSATYSANARGTSSVYSALSKGVSSSRDTGFVTQDWAGDIE